jgi:hypothetical protein
MDVVQAYEYFEEVKLGLLFRHPLDPLELIEQLAARTIYIKEYITLHTKDKMVFGLKGKLESSNKFGFELPQYKPLILDNGISLSLENKLLID